MSHSMECEICNAVPLYREAPVSLDILEEYSKEVIAALEEKSGSKKYIVIDRSWSETAAALKAAVKELQSAVEVIETDPVSRFVYANSTALLKVVEGEKPIPSGRTENAAVYQVEDLVKKEEKNVYVEVNGKKPEKAVFPKYVKAKEILEQFKPAGRFKGMYFGYPMGMLLDGEDLDQEICLTADYIAVYDENDCMLDRLLSITEQYTKETCGRCVFGYEGTAQIQMILSDLSQKKGKTTDIDLLLDLCGVMKDQTICEIGSTAAETVCRFIEKFRPELEEHVTKKACRAGVCSKYVTYHILPDFCTGCNECQDICEEEAILGKKRFIHVIDQEECSQCGACLSACEEEAIVKAGSVKPRCPKRPVPCKR